MSFMAKRYLFAYAWQLGQDKLGGRINYLLTHQPQLPVLTTVLLKECPFESGLNDTSHKRHLIDVR